MFYVVHYIVSTLLFNIFDPGAQKQFKSLGYICSQKCIVWVKIIDVFVCQKNIRKLSKDHVP